MNVMEKEGGRQISADKSERIVTTLCPRRITRPPPTRSPRVPFWLLLVCTQAHNRPILLSGINIPKTRGVTWRILGTGIPEGSSKFFGGISTGSSVILARITRSDCGKSSVSAGECTRRKVENSFREEIFVTRVCFLGKFWKLGSWDRTGISFNHVWLCFDVSIVVYKYFCGWKVSFIFINTNFKFRLEKLEDFG